MASAENKTEHLERTAAEPRDKSLHTLTIGRIDQVNDNIRLFRLEVPPDAAPVRFLPGQWLDVYVPAVPQAGGFTITSTPADARAASASSSPGFVDLAIRRSPANPPAAYLWRDPAPALLGTAVRARVGGSFVWPPPGVNARSSLRRVVFVAGGLGVNPLVSMLGAIARGGSSGQSFDVRFLYAMKDPGTEEEEQGGQRRRHAAKMLFVERIAEAFHSGRVRGRLQLFLTGAHDDEEEKKKKKGEKAGGTVASDSAGEIPFEPRRLTIEDVEEAVGDAAERRFAVVYVCGVPAMTDELVQKLTDRQNGLGMEPHRVLCEKWW
ncbi:NADH-cytochrome b-5 reductase [Xylariomycetidae sp. FL0641]|nr:NADH-cytochrome b-5 reductase [Xylariomycetidae sp. FL0641]